MLDAAVRAPGDPVGVGPCIAERVSAWMAFVQQRAAEAPSRDSSSLNKGNRSARGKSSGQTTPRFHAKNPNGPSRLEKEGDGTRGGARKKTARKASAGDPARVLKPLG